MSPGLIRSLFWLFLCRRNRRFLLRLFRRFRMYRRDSCHTVYFHAEQIRIYILQSGRDNLAAQVVNVVVRQANIHSQISAQKCVFHVSEIHISEISRRLLGSFLADFARIRRPLFDSISKICYTNPSRVFNNSILPEYRYIHVPSLLPICPKTGQV